MKKQLASGWPVVSFILQQGFQNNPYRSRLGHYDHIVPVWGIYSNHDLRDPAIYEDDYIVMASNYGDDG